MVKGIDYDRMADLYDALVTFDADIPFFLESAAAVDGAIIELMAGTGRVSLPLAERTTSLVCVDSSARMLARLRAGLVGRELSARLVCADVMRLGFSPVFDLALLPFNSFSELVTMGDRVAGLESIHSVLKPGGSFMCTLHNPALRARTIDGKLRTVQEVPHPRDQGRVALKACLSLDDDTGVVTGIQLLQEMDPDGEIRAERTIDVRFSLPERAEFEALAESAGFRIVSLFGDYDRSEFQPDGSRYMIWVLRK